MSQVDVPMTLPAVMVVRARADRAHVQRRTRRRKSLLPFRQAEALRPFGAQVPTGRSAGEGFAK